MYLLPGPNSVLLFKWRSLFAFTLCKFHEILLQRKTMRIILNFVSYFLWVKKIALMFNLVSAKGCWALVTIRESQKFVPVRFSLKSMNSLESYEES